MSLPGTHKISSEDFVLNVPFARPSLRLGHHARSLPDVLYETYLMLTMQDAPDRNLEKAYRLTLWGIDYIIVRNSKDIL